jgi:hypothetical protein
MGMESGEINNNIPSDEDFARASKHMHERFRNLDIVRSNVIRHFKGICSLHEFEILFQIDEDFRAYVFFEKDLDIEKYKNNGIIQQMINFVYAELEHAGRGNKNEINVVFELDSDENVLRNYGGDYFLRLR